MLLNMWLGSALVAFMCVFMYHYHYLIVLMSIEVMLLIVLGFLLTSASIFSSWFILIFLLVFVCMGGFSLSLLVSLSRSVGRDFSEWYLFFKN